MHVHVHVDLVYAYHYMSVLTDNGEGVAERCDRQICDCEIDDEETAAAASQILKKYRNSSH